MVAVLLIILTPSVSSDQTTMNFIPPQFNLTGQINLLSSAPEFNGNYSSVYRGILHGRLVSRVHQPKKGLLEYNRV